MGASVSVCYRGYGNYILKLENNLIALRIAIEEVKALRDDLIRRVAREEDRGLQRVAQFQVWGTRVECLDQKVGQILDDPQVGRNRLSHYCSVSRYKFGKKVYFLLRECESLKSRGHFDVVAERPIYTPVLAPSLVGLDRTFEKIRQQLLMNDEVMILGLYGMGGVGKTTLLSQLYRVIRAEEVSPFDVLIWIVVSPEVQIHRIQDHIGKSISLYNEEWGRKSEFQKAVSIDKNLRNKKILVMFDDLWGKIDLGAIGIPFPTRENGGKIVFTTRLRDVCKYMRADTCIEVRPLETDDAWDLFRETIGETTLQSDPEITRLAREIADRCSGLPLVLKVVGASMASKKTKEEWQSALDQLICPVPEPDHNLLLVLKLSYNTLNSEQAKLCFLFCALFPEDEEIRKEDLIDLWRGEGIIDENTQDRARSEGYTFIEMLLLQSLLMEAGESGDKVVLHPVLRELAFYIASHPEEDKENFILESYTQVGGLKIKNWRDVGRVLLVGDDIKTISGVYDCPKLKTLFIRDTKLETISPEFFSRLPALLVLDLSSNKHLNILPDAISELVSLRYLNLSSTGIKRLPLSLSELKKMTYLNLEHTHMLTDITRISDLVNIQVLGLCDSGFRATCSLVEELQLLEHLQLLTITLQDEDVVQQFISCPKLAKCTQGFYLNYCVLLSTISITSLSGSLRCLDVQDSYIPEMKIDHSATGGEAMITVNASPSHTSFSSLYEVRLDGCSGLRELTWLLFAPSLVTLRVVQSRDMEEIISKEKAANLNIVPFLSLKFLALEGLDKLRSIYWNPLPLPELREIRLRSCPGLTKLPVNSQSAQGHSLVLSAEKELMQRIEWEDSATKQRLFPSYAKPLCFSN